MRRWMPKQSLKSIKKFNSAPKGRNPRDTETQRHRDTETQTQTHTHTHTQTHTQTHTDRHTQTHTQTHTHRHTHTDTHTDTDTQTHTHRRTDTETQTYTHTHRHTDTQTHRAILFVVTILAATACSKGVRAARRAHVSGTLSTSEVGCHFDAEHFCLHGVSVWAFR